MVQLAGAVSLEGLGWRCTPLWLPPRRSTVCPHLDTGYKAKKELLNTSTKK